MSTEKKALDAMLAQYESNNKPKYEGKSDKVYDLKNYFNTFLKPDVKTATKQIRILPTKDGSSPFVEFWGHKTQVDGDWKTFTCLQKEKNEECPFCDARMALLATGKESDKELAKKYSSRKMYVLKVIDREHEDEGVKFWRFNHDYSKQGVYDKLMGVISALKKDVTLSDTGRDFVLTINRNQTNTPIVSSVASLDPSPLSEDAEQAKLWLSDERTWRDVYAIKNYDYLEIIVKGGVPVWDKDEKKFVDKTSIKDSSVDKLDAELTLGANNLKNGVVEVPITSDGDEGLADELPF